MNPSASLTSMWTQMNLLSRRPPYDVQGFPNVRPGSEPNRPGSQLRSGSSCSGLPMCGWILGWMIILMILVARNSNKIGNLMSFWWYYIMAKNSKGIWEFNDESMKYLWWTSITMTTPNEPFSHAHFRRVVYVLPLSTAVAIACISTKRLKLSKLNTPRPVYSGLAEWCRYELVFPITTWLL